MVDGGGELAERLQLAALLKFGAGGAPPQLDAEVPADDAGPAPDAAPDAEPPALAGPLLDDYCTPIAEYVCAQAAECDCPTPDDGPVDVDACIADEIERFQSRPLEAWSAPTTPNAPPGAPIGQPAQDWLRGAGLGVFGPAIPDAAYGWLDAVAPACTWHEMH